MASQTKTHANQGIIMTEAFRPSSINRYINCNLWRFLPKEQKTPQQKSYLAERTKDHERLEKEAFKEEEGSCSEYFFRVKDHCDYLFKEQHLSMEIGNKTLQGTPDVYGYDGKRKKLYVLDYKTGRRYVVAENNEQLLSYALLAINNHSDWEVETIELAILNTQHDAVDRYTFMGNMPMMLLKSRIEKSIEANKQEKTFGKPGKWCDFCPAKRYCIRQRNYKALKNYADMDTDQLIYESKVRQSEVFTREKEVKMGAVSELLTPLLAERSKRGWKEEKTLPEKFLLKKPMTVKDAEGRFAFEEIAPYIEKTSYTILKKPA